MFRSIIITKTRAAVQKRTGTKNTGTQPNWQRRLAQNQDVGGSNPPVPTTNITMAYSTEFKGTLKFNRNLSHTELARLKSILGEDCRDHPEWEIAYDRIPCWDTSTQYADLSHMDLGLNEGFDGIEWNRSEKTYDLVDKVNLITSLMREVIPDFQLTGLLEAQGEELNDKWKLVVCEDGWAERQEVQMNYLDPMRALRILEGIGLAHAEGLTYGNLPRLIYVIAHQAGKSNCTSNHPDFLEKALGIEAILVESNLIPPWGESEKPLNLDL